MSRWLYSQENESEKKRRVKSKKEFGHLPANGNTAHGKPCLLDLAYVSHEIDWALQGSLVFSHLLKCRAVCTTIKASFINITPLLTPHEGWLQHSHHHSHIKRSFQHLWPPSLIPSDYRQSTSCLQDSVEYCSLGIEWRFPKGCLEILFDKTQKGRQNFDQ